jgi:hypothetical protein
MHNVFDLLDHEWARLRVDRAAARRLAPVCRLGGAAHNLGDLERHVRAADPVEADRVLLALVTRVVVDDDQLAARVLLQLLLPGTRNLARRWWVLGDHDERAAAAVSAVYDRIRTYPLARRPGRVAANVLMDAARQMRRSVPRLETTADPAIHERRVDDRAAGPDGSVAAHPALELVAALTDAVDAGLIERRDAQLIAQSRIGGLRIADLAAHHRVGSRTLWDRRQRAEQRLVAAGACA